MGETIISGTHLSYSYQTDRGDRVIEAVKNVSFKLKAGNITAILGESGSGKTTLLKLIYGLIKPERGNLLFNGEPLPDPEEVLIPGHPDMSIVSQAFDDLNTYANVWDNVSSQLSNTDVQAKERDTKAILKKLGLLPRKDHRLFDLSGGEKQRVALARALVSSPSVLLLDEPFNQVDASFRDGLQEDIRGIVQETGLTILMVSHDPAEVLSIADHILVMRKGRLSASGAPKQLYQHPPNRYVAKLLSRANILKAEQAQLLSIPTGSKRAIGIHLEAIKPLPAANGSFIVKAIRFRGLYTELLLMHTSEPVEIRCVIPNNQHFQVGERVLLEVEKHFDIR